MEESRLIFITGGARSGKSYFAEKYTADLAKNQERKLYYLATANQSDDEMKDRIKRHQLDRKGSGLDWETIECPTRLRSRVNVFPRNSVVLLDCLTILLSNELFENDFYGENLNVEDIQTTVIESITEGIDALVNRVGTLVIVSNEVVYEPIAKDHSLVQIYSEMLGLLHQYVVRNSREAYLVEAGIPLLMKGNQSCVE